FPVTSRGLVWSTSRFPTVTSNLGISYNGTGAGAFVTELSDLITSTTYYVRAFATNSQGTSYGQERYFTTLAGEFSGGTGTEEDPYLVSSAEQLYNVRNYLNAHFKQTADINLGVEPWNLDQGWEPIGSSDNFQGTYDGDGFEISGLYINRPTGSNQALFGIADSATLQNITLNNISVTAEYQAGALLGWGYTVNVQNCSSSGEITGSESSTHVGGLLGGIGSNSLISNCSSSCTVNGESSVGGLIGSLSYSSVSNCFSTGSVNGSYYTGGLIGQSERSQITRCSSNAVITGDSISGGLIGYLYSYSSSYLSGVSECHYYGTVNCSEASGGLIGYAYGYVTITDSYSTGSISGTSDVGGAFGYIYIATITNCYSYGSVSGTSGVGGLIGSNTESSVTRSYWDTQSSGQAASAGGTGKNTSEMLDIMTFLRGGWDIKGAGSLGIWNQGNGRNSGYPYLDWEYPDDPANPAVTTPYAPGLSTQACTDIGATSAVFNGTIISLGNPAASTHGFCWNTSGEPTIADSLIDLGTAGESGAYCALVESLSMNTLYYARAFATNSSGTAYGEEIQFQTLPLAAIQPLGAGSEADPYLISSLANLYWVSRENQANSGFDGKYLKQTADIDASSTQSWIGDQGWEPIGNGSSSFRGTYDGDGYEISGLYINRPTNDSQALFGNAYSANINNLQLTEVSVSGFYNTGSLIGYADYCTVQNCSSSGFVSGSPEGYYTGGLVGYAYYSQLSQCSSINAVSGSNYTGGLVGYLSDSMLTRCTTGGTVTGDSNATGGLIGSIYGGQVEQCSSNAIVSGQSGSGGLIGESNHSSVMLSFFNGSVSGTSCVGGVVGVIYDEVTISDCYNVGTVTGTSYVGGAFGYIESATITNCYSYGSVSGTSDVGGLIGYNTDSSVIRSYWDTQSSGQATSAGGNGKTTAEMQDVMTFLAGGWDIKGAGSLGIWNQGNGRNSGYPYLDWQYPDDPANPAVTTPYAPVLSTQACTEIGATSAVFNGTIISMGNPAASAYGFCWNTSGEPTIADSLIDLGTADESGAYSALVESLSMNTLYYARAFATNGSGTAYGEEIQFQTLPLAAIQPLGTGSEADPYLISSLANLYWVSRENQANSGFDGKY
ncbi:MAG: GLUG motif-containing protein, partial [Kiritimatiellae bacterium]|nr:GLUG motif-containing protein [Kiritimatiellia bacterium]